MNLIIVSGLSGSGKSIALHALEDLGYFFVGKVLEVAEDHSCSKVLR